MRKIYARIRNFGNFRIRQQQSFTFAQFAINLIQLVMIHAYFKAVSDYLRDLVPKVS